MESHYWGGHFRAQPVLFIRRTCVRKRESSRSTGAATPPLQETYDDISSGKSLQEKIAGKDEVGQHKLWATQFVGWGQTSPDALVQTWLETIETLAIQRAVSGSDDVPGLDNTPIAKAFVSVDGLDFQQLIQKFLLGAVAFSQAADDYLDDDTTGKGLLSDNIAPVDGKPYTELEHAWDEGWGYFGMSPFFATSFTVEQIANTSAGTHYKDANGDGKIDLLGEYNFGHAQNAAKRDLGSASTANTDFSHQAFEAFKRGRAIISNADGALSTGQMTELKQQRDIALSAWEKAIAATAVHYINECLRDIADFGITLDKPKLFLDYTKHWSELKGFALSFQFNRRSPLTSEQFASLHAKIGNQPVLYTASQEEISAYKTALLEARNILQTAYEFDNANMGDENGKGGW